MGMKTQQELYDLLVTELQSQRPDITDLNEGSIADVISGIVSVAVNEVSKLTIDEFRKTFFETANGPEVTGLDDELQTLAVDHFGPTFSRPSATYATGVVTFSRANTSAGNCLIPSGTVVKTALDASGSSQRFATEIDVTMVGLTLNASVKALSSGIQGSVQPNQITLVESVLTDDSITVNNSALLSGGKDQETDAEYRATIRNLIETLKGSTLQAIESSSIAVAGVEYANAIEFLQYVKEWNIGSNTTVGDYFAIPRVKLYIADANGTSSPDLISNVLTAIKSVRAAGVRIEVLGASAIIVNWTGMVTLNPSGPNYSTLISDTTMLQDSMKLYLQNIQIGQNFSRQGAINYMMSIWGPSGTNDLTVFNNMIPSGDISISENQKIIPGTIEVI